ncbi:MAG TPA: hypothetical protein DEA08_20980 [Planctomycetes bacterium]|nr:hypothetical protein [Planctomycetota bacterium]
MRPAQVIDERFELQGELGRGGMGVVFRAFDRTLNRPVALKAVIEERLSPERRERFRREGQVTAALSHPHVLRVHAAGDHQGRPYLAYELVEGARTYEEALPGASREQVLTWVRDAARGLGAAHARGIVHRDVKPENLLVDSSGLVKVADFGLALAVDSERLTKTGAILGTPQFMAPELFAGKGHQAVGPATDVWALGVLLYWSLAQAFPFEGASMLELAAQIASGEPIPLRQRDRELPRALESVCAKALAKEPERRYGDGDAFADELDRFLRGEAISASGVRRTSARGRKGLGLALVAGAAVAILLGAALLFDPQARVRVEASPARTPSARPSAPPATPGEGPAANRRRRPRPTPQPSAKRPPTLDDVISFVGKNVVGDVTKDKPGVTEFQTGELFRQGQDWKEMRRLYVKAAGLGNVAAVRRLAEGHLYGRNGMQVDLDQAVRWLRRGVELGHVQSMRELGVMLWRGQGVPQDAPAGLALLEPCAAAGDADAARALANLLQKGAPGVPANPEAVKRWRAVAEAEREVEILPR